MPRRSRSLSPPPPGITGSDAWPRGGDSSGGGSLRSGSWELDRWRPPIISEGASRRPLMGNNESPESNYAYMRWLSISSLRHRITPRAKWANNFLQIVLNWHWNYSTQFWCAAHPRAGGGGKEMDQSDCDQFMEQDFRGDLYFFVRKHKLWITLANEQKIWTSHLNRQLW